MIVTYQHPPGKYSAATSAGVICYQLPRHAAVAAIAAAVEGLSLSEIEAALDNTATPEVWRATWASSVTHGLADIGSEVDEILDRDRADKIEAKLAAAMEMLAEVHQQNAELIHLAEEEAERLAAAQAAAEREAERLEQQQRQAAEQQQQAAAKADKDRWIDRRVIQVADDVIEIWREIVEFVGRIGPQRTPEFRRYSIREARYSVTNCPADVRARLGVKPERSKPYVPLEVL